MVQVTSNSSNYGFVRFFLETMDNLAILCATDEGYHNSRWPQEGVDDISALPNGAVYLRADGCLSVRLGKA